MPDSPLVSVVMSVHNASAVVGQAIESILKQTFTDFEFIIVDDGSTDGSRKILRKYAEQDKRIKLYVQPQSGLIASLNKYCRLATGKYIARMDADDVSLPARLEKQTQFLEMHPKIGVLGTWIQDIDLQGKPIIEWPVPSEPAVVRWFLFFGNCVGHPSVMMRRDLFERLGYYRPEALHVEDYDLWIRAAEITGVANLPEVLVQYRVSANSVSGRNATLQEQNACRLRREMIDRFMPGATGIIDLHHAYVTKLRPGRNQRAEIALDVIRRTGIRFQSLRLLPDLLTVHTAKTVFSLAAWFIKYRGAPPTRPRI
jgi:glycosyltransferase involved in cell wall biosynthesis